VDKPDALDEVRWLGVIGRATAVLALHNAGLTEEDLVTQSDFLERLGLLRRDVARVLGTSEDSLRVLKRRAEKSRGTKKPKGAKKPARKQGSAKAQSRR
jgi:hypothetical protein